jgi:hypothetical protein
LLPIECWFGRGKVIEAEGSGLDRERLLFTQQPVVAIIVINREVIEL